MERQKAPIVLAVTGHRDLRPDDVPVLKEKVKGIFTDLRSRYKNSPFFLLSPLAEGADRLVAKMALDQGIKLVVPLPMPEEEYLKDFDSAESRNEFNSLLNKAEYYFTLPELTDNGIYSGDNRDKYYEQMGAFIAHHSHILIALWDGEESSYTGGTQSVVDFMLKGIPRQYQSNYDPLMFSEPGVVYHLVTPRQQNPLTKFPAFSVREMDNIINDNTAGCATKHNGGMGILGKIDEYNQDIGRLSTKLNKEIEQSKDYLMPAEKRENLNETALNILEDYAAADSLAIYYQKFKMRSLKFLLGVGVVLIMLFLFYDELESNVMLYYYISLFGLTYLLYLLVNRFKFHQKHLDYRALAEGLRVQFFWQLAGFQEGIANQYLRGQQNDLAWIRKAILAMRIENLELAEVKYNLDEDTRLSYIVDYWVADQLKYFQNSVDKKQKSYHKHQIIINSFFVISFILIIAITIMENTPFIIFLEKQSFIAQLPIKIRDYLFPNYQNILLRNLSKIMMGFIAALIAVFSTYMDKAALNEEVKKCNRMYNLFKLAKSQIDLFQQQGNLQEIKVVLQALGRESLIENGDWVLLFRERPIDVPQQGA